MSRGPGRKSHFNFKDLDRFLKVYKLGVIDRCLLFLCPNSFLSVIWVPEVLENKVSEHQNNRPTPWNSYIITGGKEVKINILIIN